MNIFEWIGRQKGLYRRGLEDAFSTTGQRPSIGDDTAFIDAEFWGEGLLGDSRPRTKSQFADSFEGWVYTCVKRKAEAVANVKMRMYVAKEERSAPVKTKTKRVDRETLALIRANAGLERIVCKAEDIEEITEHVFLDLVTKVNPFATRRDLWESTSMFLDLTGEAYWYTPLNSLGVPQEIWVIPAQFMNPIFGRTLDEAIIGYRYKRGSVEVKFSPEEIVFFEYPNPQNPFSGYATTRGIAYAVFIARQMNEFESALFVNRARPGGLIVPKGNISRQDFDRLEQQFADKFAGAKKAGRTMLTTREMEYIRDTMTPEELSYTKGRVLNREEICAAYGVPAALFDPTANRANVEGAQFTFAKYGIDPMLQRLQEKVNEKIISRFSSGKKRLFVAFDSPVPEDKEFKLKEKETNLKTGFSSINEERKIEGRDESEWGAVPILPMTMAPIGSVAPIKPTEEEARQIALLAKQALREMING